MHNENLLEVPREIFDVTFEFVLVRVAGEGVDRCDLGANGVRFAEDVYRISTRKNLSAQCVFRTESNKQDQVVWIADVVLEMMKDAPGFTHPGGTDDDGCVLQVIELH